MPDSFVERADVLVTSPGRNFVTLKITTSDGVVGWGDATLNGRELSVASYLSEHVVPLLIGRDPHRIDQRQPVLPTSRDIDRRQQPAGRLIIISYLPPTGPKMECLVRVHQLRRSANPLRLKPPTFQVAEHFRSGQHRSSLVAFASKASLYAPLNNDDI